MSGNAGLLDWALDGFSSNSGKKYVTVFPE
jgi:hypothetical protein